MSPTDPNKNIKYLKKNSYFYETVTKSYALPATRMEYLRRVKISLYFGTAPDFAVFLKLQKNGKTQLNNTSTGFFDTILYDQTF